MKFVKHLFRMTIVSLLLTSCSSNETRLDAKALQSLMAQDRRTSFTTLRYDGYVRFFKDGSSHISIPALGEDDGDWSLDGDKFCIKWQEALGGELRCAHLYSQDQISFSVREPNTGVKLGTIKLN